MTKEEKQKQTLYEKARNKLIPIAEKFANKYHGSRPRASQSHEEHCNKWNYCFHQKMNRLYAESQKDKQESANAAE